MEELIVEIFTGAANVNYNVTIYIIIGLFILFWGVVLGWVWLDASSRTTNPYFRIFAVLIVLFLNIVGLIIYLITRPSQSIEEIYWADLERRYLKYETAELGDCPKCAFQLQPGFVKCPDCAYELKVKCNKCGVWIDKDWKICAFCGEENQMKRRKKDKEEVSMEEMEQQVQATKDQATEAVESKKTRYAFRSGIFTTLFSEVKESISKIDLKKLGKGAKKKKSGDKKKKDVKSGNGRKKKVSKKGKSKKKK
jgi:hypothetical protein